MSDAEPKEDFEFKTAVKIAVVITVLVLFGQLAIGHLSMEWSLAPRVLGMFAGSLLLVYIVGMVGSMLKGRR